MRAPYIPSGPTPPAENLAQPRIVRYVGVSDIFEHTFHGVRVIFAPNEKFGGQKALVVDRKDVLHTLLLIGARTKDPLHRFEIAEDLEEEADAREMLAAVQKFPEEFAKAIFPYIVELANPGDDENPKSKPKRKRRTKAEIEADNVKAEEGEAQ